MQNENWREVCGKKITNVGDGKSAMREKQKI